MSSRSSTADGHPNIKSNHQTKLRAKRILALTAAASSSLLLSRWTRANTADNVTGTAANTALDSSGSYSGGLPGTGNDVVFTAATAYSGTFTINSSALSIGTLDDFNTTALSISASQLLTLNGGTNSVAPNAADLLYVASGGNLSISGTGGITLAASGNFDDAGVLSVSDPISISNGTTLTFIGNGTTTVSGNIAASTGALTVNDTGGSLTLTGANSYTGNTTLIRGTLNLGGGGATGSISSSSILVLGGGTLSYTETGSTTQTFASTAVSAGASTVTVAAGDTVALNAITHTTGGVVTIGSTGTVTTSNSIGTNNSVSPYGIIGPWAFFSSPGTAAAGSGNGTTFATVSSGNIVAYTGATSITTIGSIPGGNASSAVINYDVTASGNQSAIGNTRYANTIRFVGTGYTEQTNSSQFLQMNALLNAGTGLVGLGGGSSTWDMEAGSTFNLILAAVGGNITISGPIINNGLAGGNTTTGGNASALTIVGPNTVTLAATNYYSGATFIDSGTLSVSANTAFGGNSTSVVTINGGTLTTTNTTALTDTHAITIGAAGGTINVAGIGSAGTSQLYLSTSNLLLGNGTLTLTGNGTLNTSGAGNLRVASTNTFSGNVILQSGGVFEYGINNAVGAGGTFTINNQGELAVNSQAPATLPNNIIVNGGNNSVISFENATTGGVVSGNITLNATATIGLRDWYNYAVATGGNITGNISGAGGLNVTTGGNTSAATVILSGVNTYTGAVNVSSGTIQAGVASVTNTSGAFGNNTAVTLANVANANMNLNGFNTQIGSLTGGGTTGGNVTLGAATLTTGANNGNTTYAGIISGTGGLTKIGSGVFTLSGVNSYTGATNVNAGTLTVNHGGANIGSLASGTVTISSGATVNVLGVTSLGNLSNSGTLSLADGAIGNLTLSGTLSFSSASLSEDISSNGTSDTLVAGGAAMITTPSGNNIINLFGTIAAGNYTLITAASGLGSGFTLGMKPTGFYQTSFLNSTPTAEILTVTATPTPAVAYWTGNASFTNGDAADNWGNGTVSTNWSSTPDGGNDTLQIPGASSTVYFTAANAYANNSSNPSLTTQLDGAYSIQGLVFDTSPTGGNLTSVTINTNANTLTIGNGGLTVASTANNNSNDTISGNGSVMLNGSQAWANNSSNLLTISVPITGQAATSTTNTLTFNGNGSGNVAIGGVISDGALGGNLALVVNKSGTGFLILSGANSYSGGTTVGNGTLQLSVNGTLGNISAPLTVNGGTLDFNSTNQTVGALSGSGGTILDNGGSASTLTLTGAGGNYAGVIANNNNAGTGTLALTISGSASQTLSGVNTYTGATTITAGTLILNGTLGSAGGTAISNAATFTEGSTGVIAGTSSLTNSAGNATLAGSNTYSGNTTLTGGTLQLQANSSNTSAGVSYALGNTPVLLLGPGTTLQLLGNTSGTIFATAGTPSPSSGSSGIIQSGNGTFNFVAGNNGSGTGNTLVLANFGQFATVGNTAPTFNFSSANNYNLQLGSGTSGNGALYIYNSLAINSNTAAATLLIPGGLQVDYGNAYTVTFGGVGNITTGALANDTAGVSVGGTVANGVLTVVKNGAGALTLSGNDTYTGATSFGSNNSGTIVLANTNAIAAGNSFTFNATTGNTLDIATNGGDSVYNVNSSTGFTGTILSDLAAPGAGITHFMGNGSFGGGTLTIAAGANVTSGNAAISFPNVVLSSGSGGNVTFIPTTASVILGNVTTASTAKSLILDGTNANNQITGFITQATGDTLTLLKQNTSVWTLSGGGNYTGSTTVNGGILALTAGTFGNTTTVQIANGGTGTTATIYQSGSSVLSNTTSALGSFAIGNSVGAGGYYNLSGGTINIGNSTGGEIDIGGSSGGAGTFGQLDVSGGTINLPNVSGSGWFLPNRGAAGEASVVNISGGTVQINSGGTSASTGLYANWGAGNQTATITISGTGQYLTPSEFVELNQNGNTTNVASLNLNAGGTFQVGGFGSAFGASGGNINAVLNFNGGTLKAGNATNTTFMSGLGAAYVNSGNGTIDNNGKTITIGQAFLTPTGSGVTSVTGFASAGSGYVVPPQVTFTGGTGSGATAYATISPTTGAVTGIVVTNPGNYSVVPTGITFTGNVATGGTLASASGAAIGNTANVSGGLTFQGSGNTTLTGASTYTGPTNVNAGTLILNDSGNNTGSLASNTVSIASTATLKVLGVTSLANLSNSGTLSLADGAIGNLTLSGTLSFNSASLNEDVTASGTSDALVANGAATITGSNTINLSGSLATGNYTLITAASGLGGNFSIGSKPLGFYNLSLGNSTSMAEILTVVANPIPAVAYWTGNASLANSDSADNWGNGTTSSNWSSTVDGGNDTLQVPGVSTTVYFTAANAYTNNSSNAALTTQLDGNYSIQGLVFDTSPTGGSLTSVTINTNANTLTIGNGGLTVASTANNNSSDTINGNGSILLNGSQAWANNSSNLLAISVPIAGQAATSTTNTLTFNGNGSGNVTLGGVISNGTLGGNLALIVSKTGSGVLALNAANTFTGGVTLNSGAVRLGNAGALNSTTPNSVTFGGNSTGDLQLNGNSVTVAGLISTDTSTTAIVEDAAAGNATVTNNIAGNVTYGGVLQDGTGGGKLALLETGAGTFTLTGTSNTYTGGTTIGTGGTAAVIRAAATQALGSGTISFDSVGNGSPARLELIGGISLNNAITLPCRNNTTVAIENISGNNTLSGSITAGIGGTNYTIQSDAGLLSLTNATAITIPSGNRTLFLQGAGNGSLSGAISGNSTGTTLTKSGSGAWTLNGASTYASTTITAGTLFANSVSSSLGTGPVAVNSGGTLAGNGATGSGVVTVNAGGTITAGANATSAGTLTTDLTLNGNSTLAAKIVGASAFGTQGYYQLANPGTDNDTINDVGSTIINAVSGSPLTVVLGAPNGSFNSSFNPSGNYAWQVLSSGNITVTDSNFTYTSSGNVTVVANNGNQTLHAPGVQSAADAADFALNTSAFTSAVPSASGGDFSLELVGATANGQGGTLDVVYDGYTPSPEPGTAMLVLSGGLPMLMARRRRKNKSRQNQELV